jgi:hypothetical protein
MTARTSQGRIPVLKLGGEGVALAHFDVAIHGAVRMAVVAGCHFQPRFGAAFGESFVLACHWLCVDVVVAMRCCCDEVEVDRLTTVCGVY